MYFKKKPLLTTRDKEPQGLTSWIHHERSLTDKLKEMTGSAEVIVLSQQWMMPTLWERQTLNISKAIFLREIVMKSNGCTYWYGRTMIPEITYQKHPDFFGRLATESIRNLLFQGDDTQLIQRVSYPVNQQCLEHFWVTKHLPHEEGVFWIRLAEYAMKQTQDSFYLAELLLPRLASIHERIS